MNKLKNRGMAIWASFWFFW